MKKTIKKTATGTAKKANDFGQRLRRIRQEIGWTQAELGRRTGMQAAAINHFECGRRLPNFENLGKLTLALECSSTDLATGRDNWR